MEPHPALIDPWRPRAADWLARPSSEHADHDARPLFIGGCPRSGTTLLRSMLNNHPDLAVPAETNFVHHLWRYRVRFGDLREEENRRAIGRWLFVESKGEGGDRIRAGMPREEAIERVAAAGPTLGSVLIAVYEIYAAQQGKPRWGDKRPAYGGFIANLYRLFPDMQFLNVVRDPRAAVASQLSLGWYEEGEALAQAIATWEYSVVRVDEQARRLAPDQLLDVRYEDLVRDPEGVIRGICAFARLRDDDEAIDQMIHGRRTGKFKPGWHERLNEPISTAPIDSWRAKLPAADAALVEHATAPYLERFGYRPFADPATELDPAALAELERQRERRRRKWRRYRRDELKRRYVLERRPVAARR
jgi:hypothetical protein